MSSEFAPSPELMAEATKALGAKEGTKSLHLKIEPTDNKTFIVHHQTHVDGMPSGRPEKHGIAGVKDLLAHIKKHYEPQDTALDETEEAAKESAGGENK